MKIEEEILLRRYKKRWLIEVRDKNIQDQAKVFLRSLKQIEYPLRDQVGLEHYRVFKWVLKRLVREGVRTAKK